jgi:hypothetical protein
MYLSPAGVILINTFEETFGDMHGEGVWRKFGEKASNINDNFVALASFNGDITMMCHLLFHLCFGYNELITRIMARRRKKVFLHAQGFLLNGMDLQ